MLTLVALSAEAVGMVIWYLARVIVVTKINMAVFKAVVPVAVLVINLVVVYQVRRAATNAAANLGVQPHHHQSTSSYSVVPTVMLVATSLIYVLVCGAASIAQLLLPFMFSIYDEDTFVVEGTFVVVYKIALVVIGLFSLVSAYNFFVYLITGKRFRSELHKLFSCCLSSCSSSSAVAAVVVADNAEVARPGQADTAV